MDSTAIAPPIHPSKAISSYSKFWLMASRSPYWRGAFYLTGVAIMLVTHFGNLGIWHRIEIYMIAVPFLLTWDLSYSPWSFWSSLFTCIVIVVPDHSETPRSTINICIVEFFIAVLAFIIFNQAKHLANQKRTFWGRLENRIECGVPVFPEGLPQWFRWKWYRLRMGKSYYQ